MREKLEIAVRYDMQTYFVQKMHKIEPVSSAKNRPDLSLQHVNLSYFELHTCLYLLGL